MSVDEDRKVELNFRQRLFKALYCYPPPGLRDVEAGRIDYEGEDHLSLLKARFGSRFLREIYGKTVLDIGCGEGHQVLALARQGAGLAVGCEVRPIFREAEAHARQSGIGDKTKFSLAQVRNLDEGSVDVLISQNSFEHVDDPAAILQDASYVLKPGGVFFITFAPPWLNPFGVHMFFMIKYPWAHFLFSEKTILTVRKLYRDDGAMSYSEVEGGLNKMTIRKFVNFVSSSSLLIEELTLTPIRPLPRWLVGIPFVREFVTSTVSAVLRKPGAPIP